MQRIVSRLFRWGRGTAGLRPRHMAVVSTCRRLLESTTAAPAAIVTAVDPVSTRQAPEPPPTTTGGIDSDRLIYEDHIRRHLTEDRGKLLQLLINQLVDTY